MNKQERTQKLVWKYFWEQKINELKSFLLVILGLGGFFFIIYLAYTAKFSPEINWQGYALLIIIGVSGLFIIIWGLVDWIMSNWKEAQERAKKKMCKHEFVKHNSYVGKYCIKCGSDNEDLK